MAYKDGLTDEQFAEAFRTACRRAAVAAAETLQEAGFIGDVTVDVKADRDEAE